MSQYAALAALPAGLLVAYLAKYAVARAKFGLEFFRPEDFGIWLPFMSQKLLKNLDELRRLTGTRIVISPAKGGLGRFLGDGSNSQHNISKWGEVRAVDIMPIDMDIKDFYYQALSLNLFSGLGVYPDWQPRPGLHVDVRSSNNPTSPATWGAIRVAGVQEYVSVNEAIG